MKLPWAIPLAVACLSGIGCAAIQSQLEANDPDAPYLYKGRVARVERSGAQTVIIGPYAHRHEVSGYPPPEVGDYVKVYRKDGEVRFKTYTPAEQEIERGKVAAVGNEKGNDWLTVTMESGRQFRVVGHPTLTVGQEVRIVRVEDEFFVR